MPKQRNQLIELFRIIAAFGIVAFHTKVPDNYIPYAGLIFFVFLSPYMDSYFNWSRVRSAGQLAQALLVPWLFWMLFHAGINLVFSMPLFPEGQGISALLAGTSLHLWFLPAMFLALWGLNLMKPHVKPVYLFWISFPLTCLMLAFFAVWEPYLMRIEAPYYQWLHAAPALLAGIALGTVAHTRYNQNVIYLGLLVACMLALTTQRPFLGITYTIGLGGTVLVLIMSNKLADLRWSVQPIADCMMGVYLSHVFWIMVFNRITGRESYLTALCAFGAALLTVWIARRKIPAARRVLG